MLASPEPLDQRALPASMTLLLAAGCGLIVANLYYAQSIAGPIGAALRLPPAATGLIVTLTQIGYGAGLLLVVPLADVTENRRLVLGMIGVVTLALLTAALANSATVFLFAAFCIGLGSVAVQVLVPFAAHMAPDAARGRVVGNITSGLVLGIMMARPVASIVAHLASWHVIFAGSAVVMVGIGLVFHRMLPRRVPTVPLGYGALLRSMGRLTLTTPILRRRALYQACLFSAFSLFWTTVPLLLAGPLFRLSQGGIALFALAGVSGAVAAPIAGRVADRGWSRPASGLAMLAVATAFLLTRVASPGSPLALALLVAAAVLLDFGMTANLTLGQRAIFSLRPEYRGRLNGVFMAMFFAGGAVGSAVGGWAYAYGGWPLASSIGAALPVIALAWFATEWR